MNYCAIHYPDIANGLGVRISLFVSGCPHHCEGCFQPETWNEDYGVVFTETVEDFIIEKLTPDYIDGLTLLGGEPLTPDHQKALLSLLKKVKATYPAKNIWCYSGYLFEDLISKNGSGHCDVTNEVLSLIDVLVDGKFVMDLKDIRLRFRGSSNQRIIDVKSSLKTGTITTIDL